MVEVYKTDWKKLADDKLTDSGIQEFLDWITKHKIYTVVLLLLLIMGFSKIIKLFQKEERKIPTRTY